MYIQKGDKYLKSLSVKSEALPAGARRWNKKFEDLNWKTIFLKCLKTTTDDGFRYDLCTEFQQQADFYFCVKLLIHHCAVTK